MRQAARQASPRQAGRPRRNQRARRRRRRFYPLRAPLRTWTADRGADDAAGDRGALSPLRARGMARDRRRMKMSSRGRFNLAHPPKRVCAAFELYIWQMSASFFSTRSFLHTHRDPAHIFKPTPLVISSNLKLRPRARS